MIKMTNVMPKMTKREMFNALLEIPAVANDYDLVVFIKHELELLERKNSTLSAKDIARHEENAVLCNRITEILRSSSEPMTVTEILKALEDSELSHSKVNQLVKQLKDNGTVKREEIKRKAYFSLA